MNKRLDKLAERIDAIAQKVRDESFRYMNNQRDTSSNELQRVAHQLNKQATNLRNTSAHH